jgi:hypothetical protein
LDRWYQVASLFHSDIDFRLTGDYIEPMGIPATFWRSQDITTEARGAIGFPGKTEMGDDDGKTEERAFDRGYR